jgi:thioredoxin 1
MIEVTESTLTQAIKTNDVLLVKFGASWCAPCRHMHRALEQLEAITNVTVVEVDIDRCPILAKRYTIMSVPVTILFRNGTEFRRRVGVQTIQQLQDMLG